MILSLRQWIEGARGNGVDSAEQKVSPAYIMASIRISISLLKPIVTSEETGDPCRLPACGADWAEKITVELQNNNVPGLSSSVPAGPTAFPHSEGEDQLDDDELLARLDAIGQEGGELGISQKNGSSQEALGEDELLEVFDAIRQEDVFSTENDAIYLDVVSAKLVEDEYWDDDKLKQIHSLGLVLYELFSQGQTSSQLLPDSFSDHKGESPRYFADRLHLTDGTEYDDQYRKKKGKASSSSDLHLNHLRFKGLPSQLCDLIFNMIDSGNGDWRGSDSFTRFSEVLFDMQLMLDRPLTYLADVVLDNPKLELREEMFAREKEYTMVQSAYRRSVTGSPEIVLIGGASGTGKSTLGYNLGKFIRSNKGVFLSSKFDQFNQSKPFSALADAFNDFCLQLVKEQSDKASKISIKLQTTLGPDDLHHLRRLIPNLSLAIPDNESDDERSYQDCENAQKRLNFLFCCFVGALVSSLEVPISLFLDDLQWADQASVSVISRMLKISMINKHFFFIGSYRNDDMETCNSTLNTIESSVDFGVSSTKVILDYLDVSAVNMMISNMLCLSPRVVTSLSDIVYHKTKGCPLFIHQLMQSLIREGLLRISLSRRRWEWDEEKIQSRSLSDNVASFFVQNINRLEDSVQNALLVLSCFGASADIETLSIIERSLNTTVIGPLEIAAAEGLVFKQDECSFRFTHDRLQEAAYGMIVEIEKALHHKQYGLALIAPSLTNKNIAMLFTSVNQMNKSGPSLYTNTERVEVAEYNLLAGKNAMTLSDFSVAFSYFDEGISFLPKHHWKNHYELSLKLFDLAAKCSQIIGDTTSLEILSDQVIRRATCIQDKLNVVYINQSSLAYASKISESVEKGLLILAELGHVIPAIRSDEISIYSMKQTLSMLNGLADDDILNYRPMTDDKTIMSMKFLAKLENVVQLVRPDLQPTITVKMLSLTISHGMSPVSPIAFAYFSGLVSRMGYLEKGRRLVRLSKMLIQNSEYKEVAGEVIAVVTGVRCYLEPMQAVLPAHLEGEAASMKSGDIGMACMNRLLFCVASFWSGLKLGAVQDAITQACEFMKEQDHLTSLLHMKPLELSVKMLSGKNVGPLIEQMEKTVLANKNPHQLIVFFFNKMYMSYLFNNLEGMNECTEKYFGVASKPPWMLLQLHSAHAFFCGLVSYRLLRETGDAVWAARAKKFHSAITLWSTHGTSWNFQHKVQLLDAEEQYCHGNFEEAQVSYTNAIANAAARKFINDEALAAERAADFYFINGKMSTALEHYTHAHTRYCEWGAMAKANSLYENLKAKIPCWQE